MKKYSIIYSDPPWAYNDKAQAGRRGAEFQYPTMTIKNIKLLNMKPHLANDCVLFMWVTAPMMPQQLQVLKAWGFTYKTIAFTWVKRAKNGGYRWGMGNWTRANPEYCILGVRGNPKRVDKGVHSVIDEIPGRHSEKPDEVRKRIVKLMGDLPRLEMFARTAPSGWDAWGNQVESDVVIEPMKAKKYLKGLREKMKARKEDNV